MNYLLLTLGHGSSAIFVDNSAEQQRVIGYEQERLSGIKADSQFPIDAINEIEHHVSINKMKGCVICISHWFNNNNAFEQTLKACKYITTNDIEKLMSYKPKDVFVTDRNFTHHDAHAYSAYAFHDNHKYKLNVHKPLYCIVADGFGTNEEVLSIYRRSGNEAPKLIHRTYGYATSLGLFYQYATSFVGMKENQDEYKFLGYEAHIDEEISPDSIAYLDEQVNNAVQYFMTQIMNSTKMLLPTTDGIIDFDGLHDCKMYWYSYFTEVLRPFDISVTSFTARCAIAYFIQQTVEKVLESLIEEFNMDNICVAGGCFYNVKLNNKVLSSIKGDFCAMPLAGDQGAAIGMYKCIAKLHEKPFNFGTLCWGERRMYNAKKLLSALDNVENVIIVDEIQSMSDEFIKAIAKHIADNRIINLVRGNMEFGPRALCNTSTLMLPSTENVATNNKMNNRNEVMPCAPVCTYKGAAQLFDTDELERVVGSDRYMVCTHDYIKPYSKTYGGVMHHKTLEQDVFTGRPQIVSQEDRFMVNLLYKVEEICDAKCLVNTSFNAHGNPIVFDVMDIIRNFKYQCEHIEYEKRPILVVIL